MLQPSDRQHLLESLCPPKGYSLDAAIGTTFTLDLLALLTAPLAFTTFGWADEGGHFSRSPQALLATMEQYADRISIFCQTGKIAIPKTKTLLYSYLENSVIEVNAPSAEGIFHPKIWVLRFVSCDRSVFYRFLCLSRNLTFDRSWDTILLLDGQFLENSREIDENRPLSHFIASLPHLAHNPPISKQVQTRIDTIEAELLRVRFELPIGFEQLKFHPLGLPGNKNSPFSGSIDRLLIVSPFVCQSKLSQLNQKGNHNILISRSEELEKIAPTVLNEFSQIYQINPAANLEKDDDSTTDSTPISLVGLHAKVYIADTGNNARIWTGSANATDAAFKRNVEFLVEMIGKKHTFGIDTILAFDDKEVTFRSLLETFTPRSEILHDKDEVQELIIEQKLRQLHLAACVFPTETTDRYSLELRCLENQQNLEFPPGISWRCYPMTCPELAKDFDIRAGKAIEFKPLSCQAITSFFAFEMYVHQNRKLSFMLNVPLEGVPVNRKQQILRSLLQDKSQVLKLILLLLSDSKADARELLAAIDSNLSSKEIETHVSQKASTSFLFPVFEMMLQVLDRNPTKLDCIARLLEDLQHEQLLPDGFEEIWQPIYTARKKLKT